MTDSTTRGVRTLVVSGTLSLDTTERAGVVHDSVPGGSALYAAAGARLLIPTRIVGTVGRDFPFDALGVDDVSAIDMSSIAVLDGPTFRWSARYEADGNQRVTLSRDAGVAAGRLPDVPRMRDGYALLLASTDPRVQTHVRDACASASLVGLDSMAHWWTERRDALLALLRRVDVVFVDEGELALATDSTDAADGVQRLLALGAPLVVVKRGARGALMQRRHEDPIATTADATRVADTTGAGDAFAGAFMAALVQCPAWGDRDTLQFATAMASFAVEGVGVSALGSADFGAVRRRMASLDSTSSRRHGPPNRGVTR